MDGCEKHTNKQKQVQELRSTFGHLKSFLRYLYKFCLVWLVLVWFGSCWYDWLLLVWFGWFWYSLVKFGF